MKTTSLQTSICIVFSSYLLINNLSNTKRSECFMTLLLGQETDSKRLGFHCRLTEAQLFLPRCMHPPRPNREADMW